MKFIVYFQCLNVKGFSANIPLQCCHVTIQNYFLKSILYEDGGKMSGDATVE